MLLEGSNGIPAVYAYDWKEETCRSPRKGGIAWAVESVLRRIYDLEAPKVEDISQALRTPGADSQT